VNIDLWGVPAEPPQLPPEDYRPRGVRFRLEDGTEVAVDLKYCGIEEELSYQYGYVMHSWEPMIEGDLAQLLPKVIAFEADYWPIECAILSFGTPDEPQRFMPEDLVAAWVERILANSPMFNGCHQTYADGAERLHGTANP